MNKKTNSRYVHTEENIIRAFLILSNSKEAVSIASICKQANINRSSFYLHFTDLQDLTKTIQSAIFSNLLRSYSKKGICDFTSFESFRLFAEHIKDNANFYKLFFKHNTQDFPIFEGYHELRKTIINPYFERQGITDERIINMRFVCFQAGLSMTLKYWIDHDTQLSSDEIAVILAENLKL